MEVKEKIVEYIFISILLIIKISWEEWSQFSLEEGQERGEYATKSYWMLYLELPKNLSIFQETHSTVWTGEEEPNILLTVECLLL